MHDAQPSGPTVRPKLLLQLCGMAFTCGIAGPVHAQSIELIRAQVTIDRPVLAHLTARGFDPAQAPPLDPQCITAHTLQAGGRIQELQVRTHSDESEPLTQVLLAATEPVIEPIVRLRIQLHCGGAALTREFTLLSDAPAARPRVARTSARRSWPASPSKDGRSRASAVLQLDPEGPQTNRPRATSIVNLGKTEALGPPAAVSPAPAVTLEPWLQELHGLREELRHQRLEVASLLTRVDREERGTWEQLGLTFAIVFGLLMGNGALAFLREAALPRLRRSRLTGEPRAEKSDRATQQPITDAPSHHPGSEAPIPGDGPITAIAPVLPAELEQVARQAPSLPRPAISTPTFNPSPALSSSAPHRTQWAHADFGKAQLDTEALTPFLREVDKLSDTGYHGAAVVILENALQRHAGKSAWILLRLLQLYRQLDQAQNHERVCAQLEALYNVKVPALLGVTQAATNDLGLLELRQPLAATLENWHRPNSPATLAQLIVRQDNDDGQDRLPLTAFEDALLLFAVASELHPPESELDSPPFAWKRP